MKICTKCNLEKSLDDFKKDKKRVDGHTTQCKKCYNDYNLKKYYENHEINRLKGNRNQNKRRENKDIREKENQKSKEYKLKNAERIKEQKRIYRLKNTERIKEYYKFWVKNKLKNDNLFKLSHLMRVSIRKVINKNNFTKKSRTYKILGCSFIEFKLYLESKFENWMNWDNHGLYNGELNYGWDIDHIIPLSSANNEEDLLKLCHYSNLQPLCSKINRDIKKDSIL